MVFVLDWFLGLEQLGLANNNDYNDLVFVRVLFLFWFGFEDDEDYREDANYMFVVLVVVGGGCLRRWLRGVELFRV